jgi:glutaredoxin-like YruB-family protein
MIHLKKYLLVLIVVLLSCGVSWADIYKWEDENGVVHYTDTPPGDASEWEVVGEATSTEDNRQNENDEPQRPAYDSQAITELLKELNDETEDVEEDNTPSVELYTTSWCSYCKKAKAFFRSKGIAFTEYNIEKDRAAQRRMRSLTKSRAVPFAVINGQQIQGYSASAYERALNN